MPAVGKDESLFSTQHSGLRLMCVTLACFLLHLLAPDSATAPEAQPSDLMAATQDPAGGTCKEEPLSWLEPSCSVWRQEYLRMHLAAYLFRKSPDAAGAVGPGDAQPVAAEEALHDRPQTPGSEALWEELYGSGERYLAAGFLTEAMGEYERSMRPVGLSAEQRLLSRVGLIKANIGMGRLEEANRGFQELSGEGSREEPAVALVEAILACFAQDFERASALLGRHVASWRLVPNLEVLVGYSLLRLQRYEEAGRIFQIAAQSGWKPIRDFALLGLSDSLQATGRCKEAESSFASVSQDESPAAILGVAELGMRAGDLERAGGELKRLISCASNDYWKGIAYTYLLALKHRQGKRAEWLQTAREARGLALTPEWERHVREQRVRALEESLSELAKEGSPEDILLLAGQSGDVRPFLSTEAQRVIREAYERLGFMAPDSGVSKGEPQEDPGAQLRAARMAWMNEQVETAWELLGQYEKKGSQVDLNEARLLRACLLFQLGNLDGASKCLEGSREGVSIEVLLGVAKVESRLRMFGEAAADFGAALEKGLASQDERRHVHRRMAELSYRQGKFAEAAHHAEMAEEKSSAGAGRAPEPVGILARVRLGQLEPANQQAGQMPSGPDAVVIREIMEVQNLVEALQRNGYVR